MPERLVTGLTVLLAASLLAFHFARKQRPDPDVVARYASNFQQPARWQGKSAPEFAIETLDGKTFRLSDHVGREIVILNFFTTWSGPSKAEMPELDRFAREQSGRPLTLLAIDAEEKHDTVGAFVGALGVRFPVAVDASGSVLAKYGVDSFPTTVVIGPDGKILLYQVGPVLNADVAFADILRAGFTEIGDGKGVTREEYLDRPETRGSASTEDEVKLTGRAARIAIAMTCPCGCKHEVYDCCCATAVAIKQRLATAALDGKSDDEVIRDLGREFRDKGR